MLFYFENAADEVKKEDVFRKKKHVLLFVIILKGLD